MRGSDAEKEQGRKGFEKEIERTEEKDKEIGRRKRTAEKETEARDRPGAGSAGREASGDCREACVAHSLATSLSTLFTASPSPSPLPSPSPSLPSIVLLSISVSSNMAAPLRNLASMKVKDVPNHLKSSLSGEKVAKETWSWLYKYNEKYIQTGSIRPLNDVMLAVGVLSYFVGWPTELRHLRHAEEAAKHGKDHH